jgi:acyl-CoA synthetase (NDP forming)
VTVFRHAYPTSEANHRRTFLSDQRVQLLFEPQSIAIVGASSDPAKASGLPLRNLLQSRFSGKIYPVNPSATEISGIPCYPSVTDLPEAPDVAVLMVDARLSPQVLEECGRKGVKAAVIGSAGFAESGAEGQERQAQLNVIAKQYDIRVCGPNCHGTFNVIKGIPVGYDHSFSLPLKAGPVAIASHSGALLGVLGHRAVQANQGLSYLVSNGNEMDLDLCDFVEFFLEDETTKVVAVLMEGLKNGPRFLDLARRSHELKKTIVVLKVGKSERGAITTMAHTARMAGSGEVYEAAFRQFGVISTDTVETFLGTAQLAAHQPVPRGGRILVMTSSGAGASLMADKAGEYGLDLADISAEAKARIPERRSAILTNPFDTAGASRSPGFLSAVCEAFAADTANDCLLMFMGPLAVRQDYARNFAAASAKFGKTAAVIINLSEPELRDVFQQHHIPVFDGATDACFKMLRGYIDYGHYLRGREGASKADTVRGSVRPDAEPILRSRGESSMLSHGATVELLGACGFKCAANVAVNSLESAAAGADKLGYPVIIKGLVDGVAHRSAAGLVSEKISNAVELKNEYGAVRQAASALTRETLLLSVDKYVPHDLEMILGVKYDATFGPVILCGLGGIFTELLSDYALRLAPLAETDARDMLASLRAFLVVQKGPAQLKELIDALLRLSQLAVELNGKIKAIDINPLVFALDSAEWTVLDAKIHL